MALIKCPECEKDISSRAEFCPHCGLPSAFFIEKPKTEVKKSKNLEIKNAIEDFNSEYKTLFASGSLIEDDVKNKLGKHEDLMNEVDKIPSLEKIGLELRNIRVNEFLKNYRSISDQIEKHNSSILEKRVSELDVYFDNILKEVDPNIRLDNEQRQAIVADDNHVLLVAGAGAGKTTTMAAKVKYLVDRKNVKPEEIIVISYTNKAIDELKDRINKKLNIPVRISTFHSFAFDIVKNLGEQVPEINFSTYSIIYEFIEKSIFKDNELLRKLVLFLGFYFDVPDELFNYKSLDEYHSAKADQDYETLKSGLNEYIASVSNQWSKKSKTITGEYLRSMQEVQIANFLYINNVDYEYEKEYPISIPKSQKKYTPDFCITQGEHTAYIEHFGITYDHKHNHYSSEELSKYVNGIKFKRLIHKTNGTELIETYSSYEDNRSLISHLKEELTKHGFVLKQKDLTEVYRKIVESAKDKYVVRFVLFVMRFIELYKTEGNNEASFDILYRKTDNYRSQLFLEIVREIYIHYQDKLKERNQIDFADMINQAYDYLTIIEDHKTEMNYKYIIIDEFQDIARQRFNFTKKLAEITKAKVIAVGDDWQSIYAFAGSNISLFTKFKEFMGSGYEMKITHTYRNSQELIDMAGGFVQKNSNQIKKQLISPKHLTKPVQIITFDDEKDKLRNFTQKVVETIEKIVKKNRDAEILLLGRYNFDQNSLIYTGEFFENGKGRLVCRSSPHAKITFLTIHSSKGLGFDEVIVLNMTEGKFGFPSQIEEDPIFKLVTHEDTGLPFAEERRLFYVALTRTKNHVFIIAPLKKPSRFLVELIDDYNIEHSKELNKNIVDKYKYRCPKCGFPLKYMNNNKYGIPLYICNNEPEICNFMTNEPKVMKDIFKCDECGDGYMIVRHNSKKGTYFYGCSNYYSNKKCENSLGINEVTKSINESKH